MKNNVTLLDRPAFSMALNPIENTWRILSQTIYENGKQYTLINDFKTAIDKTWYEISPSVMQCFINSGTWVLDIIKCHSDTIKY